MIWAAISWYSVCPVITLNGRLTASNDVDIFRNQTHLVDHTFPTNNAIFQDVNSPIHPARSMQSWFEEHKDTPQYLPCPAQLPDLLSNHCGQNRVRSRIPPLSSLNGLDVLHESGTIFH